MEIYTLTPDGFGSNCYVLISEGHSAVIDPSVDADRITSFIKEKQASLDYIVLTHGHFDHVTSIDHLRDMTGAPAYVHEDDNEMLADGRKNAYSVFFGGDMKYRSAEHTLKDGDKLSLGNSTLSVVSTPGHSKGSICLLADGFIITGDTLFASGYGRFDLHGGDPTRLSASLLSLRSFDQSLTIYPGHGGSSKLGQALDNVLYY